MRDESPFGLHASTETGLAMEEVLKRRLKTVLEPWRILVRTGKRKVWCKYIHSLLEENNRFPHSVRSAETVGVLSATVGPSSVGQLSP